MQNTIRVISRLIMESISSYPFHTIKFEATTFAQANKTNVAQVSRSFILRIFAVSPILKKQIFEGIVEDAMLHD